ncbi:uncharacterized protein TNCV_1539701 [Trichonephila clavipes]|nr:uncharacterized protein TNCV_1539701 [Trichonephila clavipes]
MHPSERLMIQLPSRWICFPIQSNSNKFISVGRTLVERDIHQLGVRIMIPDLDTLSMAEIRQPHMPTFQARIQRHLLLSYVIMAPDVVLYLPSKHNHKDCISFFSFGDLQKDKRVAKWSWSRTHCQRDRVVYLKPSAHSVDRLTYIKFVEVQNLSVACCRAQNRNDSLNNVVWSIIPKDNFVELQTLRLRNDIAIILFNSGFVGLLPLLQKLGMKLCSEMKGYYWYLDKTRIVDSTRHSKPDKKKSRKKRKKLRKCKTLKYEVQEGTTYKSGEL